MINKQNRLHKYYYAFTRELHFALKSKTLVIWFFITLGLSSVSITFGMLEVEKQRTEISQLIELDKQERDTQKAKVKDWGSAAFYTFHLTYNPPSNFAFAAIGKRDTQAWQHRIRMLALEGQIYERDVANPVIAIIGRFDFAFFVTFLIPLIIAILTYGLKAHERSAGRFNLLEATANQAAALWQTRLLVRVFSVFIALSLPFIIACILSSVPVFIILQTLFFILLYIIVWAVINFWCASWQKNSASILMGFVAIWLLLVVILPASTRSAINKAVPVVDGADILLLQRETVNDAWDLPRENTYTVFFNHYPQYKNYIAPTEGFEWQWYYAFQHVGDIKTAPLAKQYQKNILKRDKIAGLIAWVLPSVLLERKLQSLAQTDTQAAIRYQNNIRDFHKTLRDYYYPKFYNNEPFDASALDNMPEFKTY